MFDNEDRKLAMVVSALAFQAVFGFAGLFGLILAAIQWGEKDALLLALAACASEVISLSFGLRALDGNAHNRHIGFALWIAVFVLAILSYVSLL